MCRFTGSSKLARRCATWRARVSREMVKVGMRMAAQESVVDRATIASVDEALVALARKCQSEVIRLDDQGAPYVALSVADLDESGLCGKRVTIGRVTAVGVYRSYELCWLPYEVIATVQAATFFADHSGRALTSAEARQFTWDGCVSLCCHDGTVEGVLWTPSTLELMTSIIKRLLGRRASQ